MSWWRALATWLLLAVSMIGNGAVREELIAPALGSLAAHQLSCVTGVLIILVVTTLLLGWVGALEPAQQLRLGAAWLTLTVGFEFVFGHWVAGHSWQALLHDYDLSAGRLWILVLAFTAASPRIAGGLRAASR